MTTPRGALVDTDVDEVTAPGELGEFGVLPGHVPLMSALKPGVLWYKAKDRTGLLAVGEGFLQVAPLPQADDRRSGRDRVLVLVDQAQRPRTSIAPRAERDLAAADKELPPGRASSTALPGAAGAAGWAQARLDAAARASAH